MDINRSRCCSFSDKCKHTVQNAHLRSITSNVSDVEKNLKRSLMEANTQFMIKDTSWKTLSVGFMGGCFLTLISIIIIASFLMKNLDPKKDLLSTFNGPGVKIDKWNVVIRIYRGPFMIIAMVFLVGINIRAWEAVQINYKSIFGFASGEHSSSYLDVIATSMMLALMWVISLTLFIFAEFLNIPPFYCPLILMIACVAYLLNPLKMMRYEARRWILKVTLKVILAPVTFVTFADIWLGDQFNSLAPVLKDFHYFVCFYAINGKTILSNQRKHIIEDLDDDMCLQGSYKWIPYLLISLPAYWRLVQCLRRFRDTRSWLNFVNAGKYSSVIISNIMSFLQSSKSFWFYLWIICQVISTLYNLCWDIKMDFGLLSSTKKGRRGLRDELVYPSSYIYYFVILEDIVGRFSWLIGFLIIQFTTAPAEVVACVQQFTEIVRRFIWNFIRVEVEHLDQCSRSRNDYRSFDEEDSQTDSPQSTVYGTLALDGDEDDSGYKTVTSIISINWDEDDDFYVEKL